MSTPLDPAALAEACKAFAPEVPETVPGIHYETEWSRLQRKMAAALTAYLAHAPGESGTDWFNRMRACDQSRVVVSAVSA